MKILLLDPPGHNKGLNTGLGYLSAVLKEEHEVLVLDLNNIEIGTCGDPNPHIPMAELRERVAGAVRAFEPDLFGVSVKTFTADVAKQIFREARAARPKLKTIAGGPHISLDGFNFLQENGIDFGIEGEGEYSMAEICRALTARDGVEKIEGIFYWRDGHLLHNAGRDRIRDLDALPFPYFRNFSSVMEHSGILEEYPLLTSRGCPFKCTYCSMPRIMGRKWRSHSPERVIEELKHAKETYHSTSFAVVDDNFTLNLGRVENICDLLISEGINLPWNSQNGIRADRIREGLAARMKRSGCRYVWIGIESAEEKVFGAINKGEKLADIQTGIRRLKKAGIRVGGFFITGLPYSTRDADLKSVEFVKENEIDAWWFNFVPYPHTEALRWVEEHGNMLRSIDGVLQYGANDIDPVFETAEYPRDVRVKTYNDIHIRMGLFDRLADPSLQQRERWSKIYNKVRPYGLGTVALLLMFMVRYNIRTLIQRMKP